MDMTISKKMFCTMMSNRLNQFKDAYEADFLMMICTGEDIEKFLPKKATTLDGKKELKFKANKYYAWHVVKADKYVAEQYEKDIDKLVSDINDALETTFNVKSNVKKADLAGIVRGIKTYFIVHAGNISVD